MPQCDFYFYLLYWPSVMAFIRERVVEKRVSYQVEMSQIFGVHGDTFGCLLFRLAHRRHACGVQGKFVNGVTGMGLERKIQRVGFMAGIPLTTHLPLNN